MGVDYHGNYKKFLNCWAHVLDTVDDAKHLVLVEVGKAGMAEVEKQIVQQGVSDESYHVRSWQRYHVGGKNGYVAIRPQPTRVAGKQAGSYQVTKYLERGHASRKPSGADKRYRPRITTAGVGFGGISFVKGYGFYSSAKRDMDVYAMKAAEHVLAQLEAAFDL